MKPLDEYKKLLLKLTLEAFSDTEKTISIRVVSDTADVFIGAKVNENSNPTLTLSGEDGLAFIQAILNLSKSPSELTSTGFHNGFLDHGVIGAWSYNFGIIRQASERWICSITASMTDEEVKAVQQMCREKHYDLDDLFEAAKDYDPDELLNSSDVDLESLFKEQHEK